MDSEGVLEKETHAHIQSNFFTPIDMHFSFGINNIPYELQHLGIYPTFQARTHSTLKRSTHSKYAIACLYQHCHILPLGHFLASAMGLSMSWISSRNYIHLGNLSQSSAQQTQPFSTCKKQDSTHLLPVLNNLPSVTTAMQPCQSNTSHHFVFEN